MDAGFALSGLAIGVIMGMTGVGGGSLMTPLLVIAFGIPPAVAVGTDLLYGAITKAGGAWVHGTRGHVDWNIVKWLAIGSIPSAIAGILLLKALSVNMIMLSSLVSGTLGIALVLTALSLLFREKIGRMNRIGEDRIIPATVTVGALLGLFVSISSVGAGALGTVALFYLYPRLSAIRVIGTDIAHAVPLTAIAGLGHASLGTVDFHLLGSLVIGSLPGIYIGSLVSSRIPEKMLRGTLAGMLILIGYKLIF